jgi:hypothetical protein
MELLDRILPKLHRAGHRVLVFCQMTKVRQTSRVDNHQSCSPEI